MTPALSIIVAEDNIVQRTYLAQVIDRLGYHAIPAEDGEEALALVKSTGAQILISDYQMPKLNGMDLTKAVRALDLDHYVHIIMITSSDDDVVRAEALEAGVDDFLSKDRHPARLTARLRVASRLVHHAYELAEQHRILKEKNDRIEADLKAAASAQRQLLPDMHKEIHGIRIASAFLPSAVVSGDMFGCVPLSPTKLGLYAVDVSGHGIHASLLAVAIGHLITPEYFASTALGPDGKPDPAALVLDLNARFGASDNDDYFTMFCGIFDKDTGRLDFCQAAYPSPFYFGPEGELQLLGDGGFPVGMFPDVPYENHSILFEEDAWLVICSDAAPEAEDQNEMPFGNDRLRALVARNLGAGADALPDIIVHALRTWRGGRALEDDLTVVALKRKKTT